MTPSRLRVLSVESCLVPRLALVHCELISGAALAGAPLLTPSGTSVAPMSATAGARGQGPLRVCLAFADSEALLGLAAGDLLLSPA